VARTLGWIRRHDLVAFPLVTFALGWLFTVPAALLIAGRPDRLGWLVLFQTPGAAAALVAGILVRHARGGTAEVRDAWRRYLEWRGHPWWWWLGAVAMVPVLAALAGLGHGSFGPGLLDLWGRLGWVALLVLPLIGVAQLASSPLLEEYGWRGFWQARLQHHLPAWAAALLVGLLWGAHHVPVALAVGADPWRAVVGAIGPSVLAAWLLNSGRGSMVGPMLLHASLNLAMAVIAPDSWWFPVLTLVTAVAVVAVSGPRELGGRPRISLPPATGGAGPA
jgi:membrane protease YdiL (CAAX protease family)